MALADINHDSGPPVTDHWDTTNSRFSITVAAALNGTVEGLQIDYAASTQVIRKGFVATDSQLNLSFYFDPNGAGTPTVLDRVLLWLGVSQFTFTTDFASFVIEKETSGDIEVTMNAGGVGVVGTPFNITDDVHFFEINVTRASSAIALDGVFEYYVDSVLKHTESNVANYNTFILIDSVFCYAAFLEAAMAGTTLYVDEVLVEAAQALTLPAMTKPASIDAAGEFIYIAALEGGTPILTKISTALDADGTTVFAPGAGDNIGVECGRSNSDVVWVAGNFDGTNVIEKSEDGGSSFTVKDDGAIGDIRAFVMGPDSDDRLLVFDETNGDILETRDNGASWDTINASVTPEVNAIARLGQNVEESVFGNDGAANNSINYSVNSGDDLEDFQTGVYPNANATRVIVN